MRGRVPENPSDGLREPLKGLRIEADFDDPFNEDWGSEELTQEELQNQRYETTILNQLDAQDRAALFETIMEAGGIQTGNLREEYRGIPNTFKRVDGLPGDEMAEYLSTYYPEFGVQDERDLIDVFTNKYAWWKGAEGSFVDYSQVDANMFYSALSNAAEVSDKIREFVHIYEPAEYEQMNTFLASDGASGYGVKPDGDIVSVFSTEKGRGDELVQQALANGGTKLDAFDGYLPEFYGRHGFEEYQREENWTPGGPDVVYMRHNGNETYARSNMNWWKGAEPYFDQNESGNFDLKMNDNDDPSQWTPQNEAFRVGDEVTHTPTGQGGHIEETLDVDTYSVMLDDGNIVQAGPQELEKIEGAPGADGEIDPTRFTGDDPEGQNFEDPTFATGEWIDDSIYQLAVDDRVHIFNPMDENGSYLGQDGTITSINSDTYTVETEVGIGDFHRNELELLEDENPHYRGSIEASWWRTAAPDLQPFPLERDVNRAPGTAPKSPFKMDWDQIDESQPGANAVPWYGDLNRYQEGDTKPSGRPGQDHVGKPKIPGAPSVGKDELARRGLGIEEMAENVYASFKWANEEQMSRGMTWYDDAQTDASKALEDHPDLVDGGMINLEMIIGVFAVISPNLSWEKNTLYPSLIVRQYFKEGITDPTKWREDDLAVSGKGKGQRKKMAIMNSNRGKVIQLFNGTPVDQVITAPKTNNFYRNIAGQSDNVTVDVWAMRICMGELKPLSNVLDPWTGQRLSYGGPSDNAYMPMHDAYVRATEMITERDGMDVSPRELQAITWGVYRDLGVNAGVDLSAPPAEGLVPEEELARMMGQSAEVVNASWWKGGGGTEKIIGDLVQAISQLEAEGNHEVCGHLTNALNSLEHNSTLEASKTAKNVGDTAEWLIEQVALGLIPKADAQKQITDMKQISQDEGDTFDLDAKLLLLNQVSDEPMAPEQMPQVTMPQQAAPSEEPDANVPLNRVSNWWAGYKE